MIKISNTEVCGWEAAIRGMRNPMNSWEQSDTGWKDANPKDDNDSFLDVDYDTCTIKKIGPNDLKLMRNLIRPGTGDHRKYLRYVDVYVDVDAPLYWWKEFDTYRHGVNAPDAGDIEMNSCSTMHKIHAKKFEIDDFSHEKCSKMALKCLEYSVFCLNCARDLYLETKEKEHWWDMIQILPTSFNQLRTLKLNYEVLRNMYKARKNHKLDEWRDFCAWIETLPYAKELILFEGD